MAFVTIVTLPGQNIWDVAVQHTGSPDGANQLILDNPDKLNYFDRIPPGTELRIDPDKVIDKKVVAFYKQDGELPPATRFVNKNNWLLAEGVWDNNGVWANEETWTNSN